MASEQKAIDITDNSAVIRLVEEAEASQMSLLLTRGDDDLAMLIPMSAMSRYSVDDVNAFLSAAGGWRDLIDTEQLKRDVYAARGSIRPSVEL